MAKQQRRIRWERGQVIDAVVESGAKDMPVREKERASRIIDKLGRCRHAGEIEHHLVDFRIAIAPNGYDALGNAVKGGEHFFGSIAFGQVVARAVIEQVAEQEHAVGRFPVDALHQSADGGRAPCRSDAMTNFIGRSFR